MTIKDLGSGYKVVGVHSSAPLPPTPANTDALATAAHVGASLFPGTQQIGESLAHAGANIANLATGGIKKFEANLPQNTVNVPKTIGGYLEAGALAPSVGAAAPASVLGAAGQYAALGGISAAGHSLATGNDIGTVAKDAGQGALIGGAVGGAFNLLGKGASYLADKAAPSALSFTSGVPKAAIQQASDNPEVAKQGLKMSVNEVRSKALGSLQSLHNDLGSEFSSGLKTLGQEPAAPEAATAIQQKLMADAQKFGAEMNVSVVPSAKGLTADFSKSPIVKGGEESVVKKALQTISTWEDYSPQGLQDLSERIGALRNFDSAATTKASPVVGKLYHSVNEAIQANYPQLSQLRTNYAANRKVLDEIGNVLSAGKDKPTQVQAAVSRLDKLFADNKDEYINVIKQLSDRSGVDYLSLLAGGEFQKVLPGFIRGLGGGGAVGIGASVLNPYLLLLAPLFSPRAVGAAVMNAGGVANATSQLTRAATTQAVRAGSTTPAPQQVK